MPAIDAHRVPEEYHATFGWDEGEVVRRRAGTHRALGGKRKLCLHTTLNPRKKHRQNGQLAHNADPGFAS